MWLRSCFFGCLCVLGLAQAEESSCGSESNLVKEEILTEKGVPEMEGNIQPCSGMDTYATLPITEQQELDIRKLIKTLANTSAVGLAFKKGELEKIGKRTYGIHPLRYIGFIYADQELKRCMPKLLNKAIVANRFIQEISAGLNEKLSEQQLIPYLPGFAESLHLELDVLNPFVDAKDWKGMLFFLNGQPV